MAYCDCFQNECTATNLSLYMHIYLKFTFHRKPFFLFFFFPQVYIDMDKNTDSGIELLKQVAG